MTTICWRERYADETTPTPALPDAGIFRQSDR